jgi:hypothetical protein
MTNTQIANPNDDCVIDLHDRAGKRHRASRDERFLDLFPERVTAALASLPSDTASKPSRETLSDLTVAQLFGMLDQLSRREVARHAAMIGQGAVADAETGRRMVMGATA